MNNINCLIVEGNITRVPEFKTTAHGYPICRLPIAVNHYYRKNNSDEYVDEVSYFDVETFGKLAEICAKFSQKGRGISVVGRIKQNRWKSEDGKAQSRITIVAEKVEFKPRVNASSEDSKTALDESVSEKEIMEKENLAEAALANASANANASATENAEVTVF